VTSERFVCALTETLLWIFGQLLISTLIGHYRSAPVNGRPNWCHRWAPLMTPASMRNFRSDNLVWWAPCMIRSRVVYPRVR